MNILFVCTGNICRSPMALVIAQRIFSDMSLDIEADSAGTYAFNGDNASDNACITAANHGLNLTNHKSKFVSPKVIEGADLILTMTLEHKADIKHHYRDANVYTICEYADSSGNIADPYGGSISVYEACYNELEAHITKIALKIAKGGIVC